MASFLTLSSFFSCIYRPKHHLALRILQAVPIEIVLRAEIFGFFLLSSTSMSGNNMCTYDFLREVLDSNLEDEDFEE